MAEKMGYYERDIVILNASECEAKDICDTIRSLSGRQAVWSYSKADLSEITITFVAHTLMWQKFKGFEADYPNLRFFFNTGKLIEG